MIYPDDPRAKLAAALAPHIAARPQQMVADNTWYAPHELAGGGLQRLMDNAEGDEDLGKIVHSLQTHGGMIPPTLRGIQPLAPPQ